MPFQMTPGAAISFRSTKTVASQQLARLSRRNVTKYARCGDQFFLATASTRTPNNHEKNAFPTTSNMPFASSLSGLKANERSFLAVSLSSSSSWSSLLLRSPDALGCSAVTCHLSQVRSFSKKRGKKAKKGKAAEDDIDDEPEIPSLADDFDLAEEEEDDHNEGDHSGALPDPHAVKQRMKKVVDRLQSRLRAIRGSDPTPDMFDVVRIKGAYGDDDGEESVPLSAVAQVVITGPTRATLTCYDPSMASIVCEAVQTSGLNLNPQVQDDDEGLLVVPLPRVSAETRRALARELNKMAEASRRRIRSVRRKAQDKVKLGKDGKLTSVSRDDAFRVGKEVDAATEETMQMLNDVVEQKQKSIMAV